MSLDTFFPGAGPRRMSVNKGAITHKLVAVTISGVGSAVGFSSAVLV